MGLFLTLKKLVLRFLDFSDFGNFGKFGRFFGKISGLRGHLLDFENLFTSSFAINSQKRVKKSIRRKPVYARFDTLVTQSSGLRAFSEACRGPGVLSWTCRTLKSAF